ncbi:hypothetical protein MMC27_008227 [Xylographa pallens]|nr:hypothetical protein [Xylographa pallens]
MPLSFLTRLSLIIFLNNYRLVFASGPAVTAAGGWTVQGTSADGVDQFQNIRFGQDTSGANRFGRPVPYVYSSGVQVNGTTSGAACPQPLNPLPSLSIFASVIDQSEDCLTLRVARPAGIDIDAALPVMVFIYGGGYTSVYFPDFYFLKLNSDPERGMLTTINLSVGQIYDPIYEPTSLVLQSINNGSPIFYVAVNYRLSIFGFAASPALTATNSLNAGLRDQCLGIQWVKDDIKQFGGNPDEITIFGESAGAFSVGLQIVAFGGKGPVPFSRAIAESGAPASEQSSDTPTVDGDFIPDAPSSLVASGRFAPNVSLIQGWNHNDGSIFTSTAISNATAAEEFIHLEWKGISTSSLSELLAQYPITDFAPLPASNTSAYFFQAAQILRDITFTCPAIRFAQATARKGARAYLYELNQTSFVNEFAGLNLAEFGVFHFSDIPYVFRNLQNATDSDIQLASQVSGSWSAFAAHADPSVRGSNNATLLSSWLQAFAFGHRTEDIGAVVNVIGGQRSGLQGIPVTGPGLGPIADENLWSRCAFIESIQSEL